MKKWMSLLLALVMLTGLFVPVQAAKADIKIGDYVRLGTYLGEPILWRCVDIDENGPLMLTESILALRPFDRAGENGSHQRDLAYREQEGSNFYPDSNIRSWLTSSAGEGKIAWLCGNEAYSAWCIHEGYHESEAGFMRSFSATAKNLMKTTTLRQVLPEADKELNTSGTEVFQWEWNWTGDAWTDVYKNYHKGYAVDIQDKVFLLDLEQFHHMCENIDILGGDFLSGSVSQAFIKSAEKCLFTSEDALNDYRNWKYSWWLRDPSAYYMSSSPVMIASSYYWDNPDYEGTEEDRINKAAEMIGLENAYANHIGVRPAFYLNTVAFSPVAGDGSAQNPYIPFDTTYDTDGLDGFIDGVDQNYMPTNINEVTINGQGTAYGRFFITQTDGTPARKMRVNYSIDGGNEKTVTTDNYGYAVIGIADIKKSKEYAVSFRGKNIQPSVGSLHVTVKPLSFQSSYEAVLEAGASVGVGFGVGGTIGDLEAEAKLGDVGRTMSSKRAFTFSQEFKDGKHKIVLSVKQNDASALEAKVGLFAGADAGITGLDVSVGDVSATHTLGKTIGVSYEDDDFDTNDTEDVENMAKFMLAAMLEVNPLNVVTQKIVDALDLPVNARQEGFFVELKGGADIGIVETKNGTPLNESVTLRGLSGGLMFDFNVDEDKKGAKTLKTGLTGAGGLSAFAVKAKLKQDVASMGAGVKGAEAIHTASVELEAKLDENDKLQEFSVSSETKKDRTVSVGKGTESEKTTYTYQPETFKQMATDLQAVMDFSKGNKAFLTLDQLKDCTAVIAEGATTASMAKSKKVEQGVELSLPVEFQLILDIGCEVGASGVQSYEFETASGILDRAVYVQAKNDIEDLVADKFLSVDELFFMAMESAYETIKEVLETVGAFIDEKVDEAIEIGKAKVKKTKETVTDWYVSVSETIEDISPLALSATAEGLSLYGEAKDLVTLGNPYVISVTDGNGKAVTDLSTNPLALTLSYTDAMLEEAGISDVSQIAVLRWDAEKCVYVKQEAVLDEVNQCLNLTINKTGQYILGADNQAPTITNLTVGRNKTPEIAAIITDASGVVSVSMMENDQEVINSENFENYYNSTTGEFSYTVTESGLSYRDITLVVKDTFGNQTETSFYVFINKTVPRFDEITQLPAVVGEATVFEAYVDRTEPGKVFLHMESTSPTGEEDYQVLLMEQDIFEDTLYTAQIPKMKDGTRVSLWVEAYSEYDNPAETEKQTVLMAKVEEGVPTLIVNRAGGEVTVQSVYCDDVTDAQVLLGVYDEKGMLIEVQTLPYEERVTFQNVVEGERVRAFLWQDMTPICQSLDTMGKTE